MRQGKPERKEVKGGDEQKRVTKRECVMGAWRSEEDRERLE